MEGPGLPPVLLLLLTSPRRSRRCASKEVTSARAGIQQLHTQVEHLSTALRTTQRLAQVAKAQPLWYHRSSPARFAAASPTLSTGEKVDANPARHAMSCRGLRALMWPFNSKEVDQALSSLERHE
ncbi:hypothetical protein VDGL01_12091 [Verticillium dahliae]